MITFKEYLNEGRVEHEHIKRMMNTIAPDKRPAARKAYHHAKKTQTHAAALNAMRVYAEDVEQFDMLAESKDSKNWIATASKETLDKLAGKRYPKTWSDVDPELAKKIDKMSQEEKVKNGWAHPSTLKKNHTPIS